MTTGSGEKPENRKGRVVAVLSGDEARDAGIREALSGLDTELRLVEDRDGARDATRPENVELVVLDADAPGIAADDFVRSLGEESPSPPPVVVLLSEPETPTERFGEETAVEHYLCRPFRAETLTALCRHLMETGSRPAAEGREPAVRVRRPARFSARPLYSEAAAYARTVFRAARTGEDLELEPGRVLAEKIHTSLLQSNLLLLRALEPYKQFELANHCVNVAVIAGKISLGLEASLSASHRVVEAGLIHDIGMTRLPDRILFKEGPLTASEREEVERHPGYGAEILEASGAAGWMVRAIRQEHERLGGQGYPDGLEGEEIDSLARVLGVADVFEAFSQARSYRSPFTLYEALEKVTSMRDEHFPREIVDALADEISVFPPDSYVQLDTGEIGRVVASNTSNLMRPTVEVLWDAHWNPLSEPRRLDLAANPEVSIDRPLHEAEVPIT